MSTMQIREKVHTDVDQQETHMMKTKWRF